MYTKHNPTPCTDIEVRNSIFAVLDEFARRGKTEGLAEAEEVLDALEQGLVNGSSFGGPNACGCLIGTGLKAHGVEAANPYSWGTKDKNPFNVSAIDSWSAQVLFSFIDPGHTPANNEPARFARDCILEWVATRHPPAPVARVAAVGQGWSGRQLDALKSQVRP